VSGSYDKTLIVWDLETGQALNTLKGHTDVIHTVSVTPDGRLAVSGSGDKTLVVWDLESGHALNTLIGHVESVTTVSVTPDGRRAVSGSTDKTLMLWDLETGQEINTLKGHTEGVRNIRMSHDGRRVVSISSDKTLVVWDLETGQSLAKYISTSYFLAITICAAGIITGDSAGHTHILHNAKDLTGTEPGFITARRIWNAKQKQIMPLTAECPFCGKRFEPEKKYLDRIQSILHSSNIGPEDSPCLKLPKRAWDEPGLFSNCPGCNEAIRFNPFVVDLCNNSQKQ